MPLVLIPPNDRSAPPWGLPLIDLRSPGKVLSVVRPENLPNWVNRVNNE